jgi:hypothetical protein
VAAERVPGEGHQRPDSWRPVGPDWTPDLAGWGILEYDRARDQVRDWPDFRFELLLLVELIAELRAELAANLRESAVLRAMTIGMLFTRLAHLLLDGDAIAAGAAIELARPVSHEVRRENVQEALAPRDGEIARLDAEIHFGCPSRTRPSSPGSRRSPSTG